MTLIILVRFSASITAQDKLLRGEKIGALLPVSARITVEA